MGDHQGGSEAPGHLHLSGEPRHHRHLDVRVQRAQDCHAGQPEGTGAEDHDLAAGGRWVAQDGVERHRKRVGQHGRFVGDVIGHRNQHRGVCRHQLGPGPRRPGDHADVDAGADVPLGEGPAQVDVPGLARGAERCDPARGAAQPRVEQHPLAHFHPFGLGPQGHHVGHHFVAGHVGKRGEGRHGVVDVLVVEIAQDQLGVRSAHTGQAGPGHHPVGVDGAGVVHLVETERQRCQVLLQLVRRDGP